MLAVSRVAAVLPLALLLAPAVARADDASMFVNVGGSIGVGISADGDTSYGERYDPEGTLAARLTLSWEPPPLPYPDTRGYKFAGAFVPEVTIGYLRVADHRTGDPDDNTDAFVTIGGRLELRMAQKSMGLLKISARGGAYVAGRVGALTDSANTPLVEIAIGEHLFIGDRLHIGGEFGVQRFFGEEYQEFTDTPNGRAPWRDGDGQYLSMHASLYVGWRL